MSHAKLAESVGLTASMISMIENGKREVNVTLLGKISQSLGIPLSVLAYLASDVEDLKDVTPLFKEKISELILDLLRDSAK